MAFTTASTRSPAGLIPGGGVFETEGDLVLPRFEKPGGDIKRVKCAEVSVIRDARADTVLPRWSWPRVIGTPLPRDGGGLRIEAVQRYECCKVEDNRIGVAALGVKANPLRR